MSTTRNTPAFDQLLREVQQIGGRYIVQIELSAESIEKANHLADTGRDFFSVTESMKGAVAKACIDAVRAGSLASIQTAAPKAIRDHIILRFTRQGYDQRLNPLSAGWRKYKREHNLDPRIGVATKALLKEVARANVTLRKVG